MAIAVLWPMVRPLGVALAVVVAIATSTASAAAPAKLQATRWPDGQARIAEPIIQALKLYRKRPTRSNLTRLYKAFDANPPGPKTVLPAQGPGSFLGLLAQKPTQHRFDQHLENAVHNDGDLATALGHVRTLDGTDITGSLAGVFGWEGARHPAVAQPASFDVVRADGKVQKLGFGIFRSPKTFTWRNKHGYLPSLVTEFEDDGQRVRIENLADEVDLDGDKVVVAYSRVSITNDGKTARELDPEPSEGLVALNAPGTRFAPGETKHFDYAAVMNAGKRTRVPTAARLRQAGGFDQHAARVERHWTTKLSEIAQIDTPDARINDAYRAGFIYTHIIRDGARTNVGANAYTRAWDHDAIGIVSGLLSVGNFKGARALLGKMPKGFEFADATYKFSWPWALYLMKTGDRAFVRRHFKKIQGEARQIGTSRTGPGGIMKPSYAIDDQGHWTVDNWSALFGLKAYEYLARELGETGEANWAGAEYRSLHRAVSKQLGKVIKDHGLEYLPASMTEPNEMNRTGRPDDANWAAHLLFGRWAWDGWLAGGKQSGKGLEMIDQTYDWGFERLARAGLPKGTFGGFPGGKPAGVPGHSSAYNAGYGAAGLRGKRHRTAGIQAAEFMIEQTQSGPYSWWESNAAPRATPWEGTHPAGGLGSSPHMWGQSVVNKVVLDSLMAEFFDGKVIVGRGVPGKWLAEGQRPVAVTNFPIAGGRRMGATITRVSPTEVRLDLTGDAPKKNVLFSLPAFVGNIAKTSAGRVDQKEGIVSIGPNARTVTVTLTKPLGDETLQ